MSKKSSAYEAAGVRLESNEQTIDLIKEAVKRTYTSNVLDGIGAFGGLYEFTQVKTHSQPVLVSSTDSIGTKTKLASRMRHYQTVGFDIVNHCCNDILVQGAKPLFFLDYLAASRLEPGLSAEIVSSVASACKEVGAVLIGGELAEMPGVYLEDEFDLVGTIVGLVDKTKLVTGESIRAGDKVLALMSGGLQTNGFSLARKVMEPYLDDSFQGHSIGLELLTPHRHYLNPISKLLDAGLIKGMAHITGGGIPGNLPRILPEGLGARISKASWPVPEIFKLIQEKGLIEEDEMYHVFNMGAGFLIVVNENGLADVKQYADEAVYEIGDIVAGSGVTLVAC